MCAVSPIVRLLALAALVALSVHTQPASAELAPDVRRAVGKAVVQISSRIVRTENGERVPYPPVPLGSGTIISEDGYILTNYHVIDQSAVIAAVARDQERLRSQGQDVTLDVQRGLYLISTSENDEPPVLRFAAQVVEEDLSLDLAVLKITRTGSGQPLVDPDPFPFVEPGDSDEISTGDPVHVFGYPSTTVGLTFTQGTISNFEVDPAGAQGRAWMNADVNVAAGSSGGAAVDKDGRLVGIPTSIEPPDCVAADTNGDGQIDESDVGCVPVGGYLAKLRPINLAKPILPGAEQTTVESPPGIPPELAQACTGQRNDACDAAWIAVVTDALADHGSVMSRIVADDYGAVPVEIRTAWTLPDDWEAYLGATVNEGELEPGFWNLYPPHAWRALLGYQT